MENLSPCYNCNGKKRLWQNGIPHLGCVLCKNFGDGKGNIRNKFREEQKLVAESMSFFAPSFSCVFCEDTKMVTEKVWVRDFIETQYSDKGWSIMPYLTFPCTHCRTT